MVSTADVAAHREARSTVFQVYADFDLSLAILYASLESFAFEYGVLRGWGPVVSQLPFLALLLGCLFAAVVNILNNIYYGKKLVANHFKPVPEARLPPMMMGGFAFSAGLFLFGCESPCICHCPPVDMVVKIT